MEPTLGKYTDDDAIRQIVQEHGLRLVSYTTTGNRVVVTVTGHSKQPDQKVINVRDVVHVREQMNRDMIPSRIRFVTPIRRVQPPNPQRGRRR